MEFFRISIFVVKKVKHMLHCYKRIIMGLSELEPETRATPESADLACRNVSECFAFGVQILFLNIYCCFV